MRPIKFRWKDIDWNWVYWCLVRYSDSVSYITSNIIEKQMELVSTDTVWQFTWLNDNNWKEIYEGDIYHQWDSRILYIVEWLDTGLKGRQNWNKSTAWILYFQSDIEIVWNIYENPDLLTNN